METLYQPIRPPFSIQLGKMDDKQGKEYFEWMKMIAPGRISQLRALVSRWTNDEWGDLSSASLEVLGNWFAANLPVENRSEVEIAAVRARMMAGIAPGSVQEQLASAIEIPSIRLTAVATSTAFDVAMYIAEVFFHSIPSLQWKLNPYKRGFVDSAQPVIAGFGSRSFNPVRTMLVIASGLVAGTARPTALRETYEVWSNFVT